MFLVLLFLTLLHAVDCPGWQPGVGAMTHGGWTARPRAPASCRTHPVPTVVATAAVPAPAPPPWGGTRDRTPEPAGGCLYAHSPRGRPGARRWPWDLFGGGVQPGQWRGSPRGSGWLAVQQGAQPPRHCGSPSHRVRPAWRPADSPSPLAPPPPGRVGAWGQPEDEHCLSGDRQLRGACQLPAPRCPCPDLLTPEPTAAVRRAEAPCPREAACPPQLTKASEHAEAGGAAAIRIAPVLCWTRPARVVVGTAAVPAPAAPLLEWPQCPDPQPGWRVFIRPHTTRAPQGEAMALGPPRGRGPARAVARGPALQWGFGGTAQPPRRCGSPWRRGWPRRWPGHPPSPRPPLPLPPSPPAGDGGRQGTRQATRAAYPESKGGGEHTPPSPPPTPPAPSGQAWPPVDLQLDIWHVDHEDVDMGAAAGEGADARPRPPLPPSRNTSGGTTASPWFAGGTARPPW